MVRQLQRPLRRPRHGLPRIGASMQHLRRRLVPPGVWLSGLGVRGTFGEPKLKSTVVESHVHSGPDGYPAADPCPKPHPYGRACVYAVISCLALVPFSQRRSTLVTYAYYWPSVTAHSSFNHATFFFVGLDRKRLTNVFIGIVAVRKRAYIRAKPGSERRISTKSLMPFPHLAVSFCPFFPAHLFRVESRSYK